MIKGNHEIYLRDSMNEPAVLNLITEKYGNGINMAIENLGKREIKQLTELEESKKINIDNLQFELCHGSPWDLNQYIYPDSKIDILRRCASLNVDFVLMGHTHYHFIFQDNSTIVANVGAIGQNRVKGGIACWALIDTDNKTLIFKQTKYDTTKLIKEVKKIDKNKPYLREVLVRC